MDNATPAPTDLRILAIDIGGTGLKASVLDAEGNPLSERHRVKTPHPLTPPFCWTPSRCSSSRWPA